MSETPDRHFFEALTMALDPYLSAEAKKSGRALRGILDLFPGQSLAEIEKRIRSLLASTQSSVPALAERARAVVTGAATEQAQPVLQAVGKLSADDLKQLGKALGVALAGTKPEMVEGFRAWLESGGRVVPLTAKDKAKDKVMQKAKEYAVLLTDRMRAMDARAAEEIIAKAEEAGKDKTLGNDGFKEFARLLGVTVDGTKPKMLKQFKDAINRMAVTGGQTQF